MTESCSTIQPLAFVKRLHRFEFLMQNNENANQYFAMLPEALAESMASEKPVFMDVRPWGSMSSIVTHSFIRGNRNLAWGFKGNRRWCWC